MIVTGQITLSRVDDGTDALVIQCGTDAAVCHSDTDSTVSTINAYTGLPTSFRVLSGNDAVPIANWSVFTVTVNGRIFDMLSSRIPALRPGLNLSSPTAMSGGVGYTALWSLYLTNRINPETQQLEPVPYSQSNGDIEIDITCTHNGATYALKKTIPLSVIPAAAATVIQYSPDNGTTIHTTYQTGDTWMRISTDGGNTWGSWVRFVGMGIDVKGEYYMHCATKADAEAENWDEYYLLDEDPGNTDGGVYELNQGAWTSVKTVAGGDLLAGDCYTTSSDNHVWRFNGSTWDDLGQLRGEPGKDGVAFSLAPSTVIIEDDDNNSETPTPTLVDVPDIRIMVVSGGSLLTRTAYTVTLDQTHVNDSVDSTSVAREQMVGYYNGSTFEPSPNAEYVYIRDIYYQTANNVVIRHITYSVRITLNGVTVNLPLDVYINRAGTWRHEVDKDMSKMISEKEESWVEAAGGDPKTTAWATIIQQQAEGIRLAATKNQIVTAGIELNGDRGTLKLTGQTIVDDTFAVYGNYRYTFFDINKDNIQNFLETPPGQTSGGDTKWDVPKRLIMPDTRNVRFTNFERANFQGSSGQSVTLYLPTIENGQITTQSGKTFNADGIIIMVMNVLNITDAGSETSQHRGITVTSQSLFLYENGSVLSQGYTVRPFALARFMAVSYDDGYIWCVI